jgi:hypothetical protein
MKNQASNLLDKIIANKSLLYLAVGVLVFFLTTSVILPKGREILEARETLQKGEKKLENLKGKLADLTSLNEFELSERNNLLLRALPAQKNPLGEMVTLRSLANELNLTIEEISVAPGEVSTPSAEVKEKKLQPINFKIKLASSRTAFFDFLKKMEQSTPLSNFDQMKISLSGDSVNAEFSLDTFFLNYPETIGSLETPVPKLTADEEKTLEKISSFTYVPAVSFQPSEGRDNPFSF